MKRSFILFPPFIQYIYFKHVSMSNLCRLYDTAYKNPCQGLNHQENATSKSLYLLICQNLPAFKTQYFRLVIKP